MTLSQSLSSGTNHPISHAHTKAQGATRVPVDHWPEGEAEQATTSVDRPGAEANEHPERVGANRAKSFVAKPMPCPYVQDRWGTMEQKRWHDWRAEQKRCRLE